MEETASQNAKLPDRIDPVEECNINHSHLVEYYHPSQFGIVHLLAWLTIAIMLVFYSFLVAPFQNPIHFDSDIARIIYLTFRSMYTIVQAAVLVGGLDFWMDRLRRKPGKLQPGHWIVGMGSLTIFADLVLGVVDAWSIKISSNQEFVEPILSSSLSILTGLFLGWGAFRLVGLFRWKCALGLLCIRNLLSAWILIALSLKFESLGVFLLEMEPFLAYATVLIVIIAILFDFIKQDRRDWIHWFGALSPVACVFLCTAINVVLRYSKM